MIDLQGFGELLLSGMFITVKLALASVAIGLILGLLGATAKLSKVWILRMLATLYTATMRGIPELLLVLFLYNGSSLLIMSILEKFGYTEYVEVGPFYAGVAALSIAFGAYAIEVFRMAIQEIPVGQWESAKAVGMQPYQTYFRIIVPQVWRLALPGLGNLFLVLLKDTALVSVVGLQDIMYHTSRAAQSTQEPFTFYLAAAFIYLGLTIVVTGIVSWMEWLANPSKRYAKRLKRDASKQLVAKG